MAHRKYDQALKDQAIEAVVKHGRSVAQTAVMVKYFRKEFKLLSLKTSYAQLVSDNSVLN
jgi:uncharacterized membrane protein